MSRGFYKNYRRDGGSGGFGGFFIALFWNILMNLGWTIPAWLLLAAHWFLNVPLWFFWLALGVWLVAVIVLTLIVSLANHFSNELDDSKSNKNPYSVTDNDIFLRKKR